MNAMPFMGTFSLFCHCTCLVMKFTVVLHTLVLMNMKVKHMRATSCACSNVKGCKDGSTKNNSRTAPYTFHIRQSHPDCRNLSVRWPHFPVVNKPQANDTEELVHTSDPIP